MFLMFVFFFFFFFFSSRRRHTRWTGDWSSDVCSSDLADVVVGPSRPPRSSRPPHRPAARDAETAPCRSEERRVGKSVDLGGRRIIKKKKEKNNMKDKMDE